VTGLLRVYTPLARDFTHIRIAPEILLFVR